MFRRALVGVGDEAGGCDALELARDLVSEDGQLRLVHVYLADTYVLAGTRVNYHVEQPATADVLLASVLEKTGISATTSSVSSASVGRALHEQAEEIEADLVVVGSSRRGSWGRILLGDDTRDSLNGTRCAIAVAPRGYSAQAHSIHQIGVAYNGSPESQQALSVARRLSRQAGAKLSACQVVMLPSRMFMGGAMPTEQDFERFLKHASERIAALGGVEPHTVYGRPADALASYSAELDLLVVGSRSYGPVGRLLHGSTSAQLARVARCPLLVLPRARPGAV